MSHAKKTKTSGSSSKMSRHAGEESKIEMTTRAKKKGNNVGHIKLTKEDERIMGIYTIPDILTPPDVNRDDDDDDDTLPYERECGIPPDLIASFPTVDLERLQACRLKYSNNINANLDMYNDLDQNIVRDNDNIVHTIDEMIARVNDYDYEVIGPGESNGRCCCIISCGIYHWCHKRKVIAPENLGHHINNGRDMLEKPGAHILYSMNDQWVGDGQVPKDDESQPVRRFGSKTIITVGENCLGGARKIGAKDNIKDGDYVIIGQGRHVLNEENYAQIQIENLDQHDIIHLGPLTVLYVKEGKIGGAYHRHKGRYQLFLPGPPYILHKKNYENIECVDRTFGRFTIGPVTCITVKDGEIGGAFHKNTGLYQVLAPGNTYILHQKDYVNGTVQARTDNFKLGPYFFRTVRPGHVAGAYRVKGGRFIRFKTGFTYQCNEDDYREPICVKKDKHKIVCGPYTYLTVKRGTLNGAYKVKDGSFVEFTEEDKEYELHEKEYRDIVTIPKISNKEQEFGPNKTITIPDGFAGVIERAGKLEILDVKFHKLSNECQILTSVPLNTFTYSIKNLGFYSKDSTKMNMNANFVWNVVDPKKVTLFPGDFKLLCQRIQEQVNLSLTAKCSTYNRDEILPKKQDILTRQHGENMSEDQTNELLAKADKLKLEKHLAIRDYCLDSLIKTVNSSNWGIEIKDLTIKGFVLCDEAILKSFENITRAIIKTKAEKVEGALVIEKANTDKEIQSREAEIQAFVDKKKATSAAEVEIEKARAGVEVEKKRTQAAAEIKKQTALVEAEAKKCTAIAEAEAKIEIAKAQAQVKVQEARAETEADIVRAEADQKTREIKLNIETREKKEKALAEADAVKAIAEAEHFKRTRENESAEKIPEHKKRERQLELITKMYVQAVQEYGKSAFFNPNKLYASIEKVEEFTGKRLKDMMGNNTFIMDQRKDGGNLSVKTHTGSSSSS